MDDGISRSRGLFCHFGIAIALLLLLVFADSNYVFAAHKESHNPPGKLISGHEKPTKPDKGKGNAVKKEAQVTVNPAVLKGALVDLELFQDKKFLGKLKHRKKGLGDTELWVGEIEGEPGSSVVFTVSGDNRLAGQITVDGQMYSITQSPDTGEYVLREIEMVEFDPITDAIEPEEGDAPVEFEGGEIEADSHVVIDLMVVYTPLALEGNPNIDLTIQSVVENATVGLANSEVPAQYNLVHSQLVEYTPRNDGPNSSDALVQALYDLRGKTDTYIDEVHDIRDQHGADIVAMVTGEIGSAAGVGFVMQTVSTTFERNAFSVTEYDNLAGLTMEHELGHNLGCAHDRDNAGVDGAFEYSYGYKYAQAVPELNNNGFRTVMSYACSGFNCIRQNYFSNPNVLLHGIPMGIDHDVDPDNSADNARSLVQTTPVAAQFRETVTPPEPPAAPTDLNATAVDESSIDLTWTDNADNETGFEIERSDTDPATGANWVALPTQGVNVVGYVDTGLAANTTYYYRTRAVNNDGESDWSNVASATTEEEPPPPDPPSAPSDLVATAQGTTSIGLEWTDTSENETGFRIERTDGEATETSVWTEIATVAANTTSYTDSGLSPGQTYSYRVIAFNEDGDSDPSNTATATTEEEPPPVVINLVIADAYKIKGRHHVDLEWSGAPSNTSLVIIRDGNEIAVVESGAEGSGAYTDPQIGRGKATYVYQICLTDLSVCSEEQSVSKF